jgi:hypothetical protein
MTLLMTRALRHLTDDELVRAVDNVPDASPLTRELANRLDRRTHGPQQEADPRQMELPGMETANEPV